MHRGAEQRLPGAVCFQLRRQRPPECLMRHGRSRPQRNKKGAASPGLDADHAPSATFKGLAVYAPGSLQTAHPIILGYAAGTCDEYEVVSGTVLFEQQGDVSVQDETAGAAIALPTRRAEKIFKDRHANFRFRQHW